MNTITTPSCVHILLLDDDTNDALLFEAMVEQEMMGTVQLQWCQSVTAANNWLDNNRVDICFIDYHLNTNINGLQWAKQCYHQHGVMAPALVMLTGETDTKEIETIDTLAGSDDSGIADFLVKQEITAPTLKRATHYAIKQQRLLREMKRCEMRARLFFDYAKEGIVTLDTKGKITQSNYATNQLFDYASGTMRGLFLSQLVPSFTMSLFRPMGIDARPLMSSSSTHQVSGYNRHGKEIPLEMSLGIVYSNDESFYTATFLDVSDHISAIETIRKQAQTDDLTGLMNRRYFRQQADVEMNRSASARHHCPLSIMMVDIDRFKMVNDTYGHLVGDTALRKVATQLQQSMREHDILCRWGGEEFLLLMPNCDMEGAHTLAERIRESIASLSFESISNGITISIGIAPVDAKQPLKAATSAADQALYQAKEQGRNRVCRFTV